MPSMSDATYTRQLIRWVRMWLKVSHMLILGIGIAVFGAYRLAFLRFPNSYWQVRLGWGWRLMLLWMIVLNYMKSQESAAGDPEISRREMQRAYLILPFALCIGL